MEKTVVALFDNLDAAQTAVQELLNNGFSRDDISVVRTNQQGDYTSGSVAEGGNADASGAAAGAGIGAVLGGLAGLLVGLGALAIPGIGPIIAAGPLATTLAGAGLGAATGGLVGALADAGIPEHEAGTYAEGVRRGGTLVTVRAHDDQVTRATEILNRFTPVDINQRAGEWQASGWSGNDANAGPYSTTSGGVGGADGPQAEQDEQTSRASQASDYHAETGYTGANSGGTYEGTGSAGYTGAGTTYRGEGSFTSNTGASDSQGTQADDMDRPKGSNITESPDRVGSSNWSDEDSVMRSGHGEMSTSTGFSGQGGGTYDGPGSAGHMQDVDSTVHPRSAEGDYQARRDFLGGDQAQGQNQSENSGMIQTGLGTYGSQGQNLEPSEGHEGTVSREAMFGALARDESFTEHASGDDMGTTGMTFRSGPSRSRFDRRFEDYDPDFRSDWETNYRSTGFGYERFQPAYQYGWQLGEQYQDRDWADFETNARTDWERSHPNDTWNDFHSAVRRGWDEFRGGAGSQGEEQTYVGMEQGAQPDRDVRNFSQDARESLQSYDRTMGGMSRGLDTYDRDFRSDWDRSFRSSGYGYERYQPAYQYGYNLATDAKYRNRNWGDVESDARRDWEMRHPNDAWEDFKDAVRHAWDRVRGSV